MSPAGEMMLSGHAEQAIVILERDRSATARLNLAIAYRWTNRLAESRDLLWELVAEDPTSASAWNSLGMVQEDFGEWEEAVSSYRRAVHLVAPEDRQFQEISLNYACALLRLQQFREVWPHWEAGRLNRTWFPQQLPLWQGEKNGRVLVVHEGGYGDAFLFGRFLSEDKQTYWLPDGIDWTAWPCATIPLRTSVDRRCFDYTAGLLSLPAVAGVSSLRDIPPMSWRGRVDPNPVYSGKWGLCWKAGEKDERRPHRSIPVEVLSDLAHFGDKWVNLCPSEPAPPFVAVPEVRSWSDTARIIAGLDLVVTVDTAVAHLAGLLGTPTVILLPMRSGWMWFTEGVKNPWWPTATLIRNNHPLDWRPAIEALIWMLL